MQGSRTLVAHFSPVRQQYVIQAGMELPTGGRIAGAGTYSRGQNVTLIAHPQPGFHFINWSETWDGYQGSCVVAENERYAFTANRNRQLTAVVRSAVLPGVLMLLLED